MEGVPFRATPAVCSACSGDPEDPPENTPGLDAEEASPLQAWWREPPWEVEENDASGE